MQVAFSAKVNSGCVSRQVGAVVTDKDYNILSLGWNDVHCERVPCVYRNLRDLQKSHNHKMYSDLELRKPAFSNSMLTAMISRIWIAATQYWMGCLLPIALKAFTMN